jgi:hypothetical protein
MSGRAPWQDGRRAWERLNGWHQEPTASPGHVTDGEAALKALGDVQLVRSLLARAEINAVTTARAAGKSWAEVAASLGITKQSAWERFADGDLPPSAAS